MRPTESSELHIRRRSGEFCLNRQQRVTVLTPAATPRVPVIEAALVIHFNGGLQVVGRRDDLVVRRSELFVDCAEFLLQLVYRRR